MNLINVCNQLCNYIVGEGIVTGKACFVWANNDCHWNRTIRIKNCRQYFVYQLPPPPAMHLRYCSTKYGKEMINYMPLYTYAVEYQAVDCILVDT